MFYDVTYVCARQKRLHVDHTWNSIFERKKMRAYVKISRKKLQKSRCYATGGPIMYMFMYNSRCVYSYNRKTTLTESQKSNAQAGSLSSYKSLLYPYNLLSILEVFCQQITRLITEDFFSHFLSVWDWPWVKVILQALHKDFSLKLLSYWRLEILMGKSWCVCVLRSLSSNIVKVGNFFLKQFFQCKYDDFIHAVSDNQHVFIYP